MLLPAERARRSMTYLCIILTAMLGLVILEVLVFYVVGALVAGDGMEIVRSPDVAGYAGLPVVLGVVCLPLFAVAWRHPALRIDSTGITKVRPGGTESVPWGEVDKVQFTPKGAVLVLVVKADSRSGKLNAAGGQSIPVPYYALGNTFWRRRRPAHRDLIVDAVERFAPGKYTAVPWDIRRSRGKSS
ncbi:PH domain-containing protein [Streptomyces sp. NBC_00876]|uniref:PH domain-containing protein n=1 Tax=Streptomyces sp. NBC_00876 TaxID=2975853 RepID=UPI003868B829|nr:PH domain-containing protein [Streptomyces sp. NBC_00876]